MRPKKFDPAASLVSEGTCMIELPFAFSGLYKQVICPFWIIRRPRIPLSLLFYTIILLDFVIMSNSPHDSGSMIEHGHFEESSHIDGLVKSHKPPLDDDRHPEVPKKSNSFDRKLMRDRQVEPRYFVYVYDYSANKTKIMKKRNLLERRGKYQTFDTSSRKIFLRLQMRRRALNFGPWY